MTSTSKDEDPRPYRMGVGAVLFNSAGRVWVGERMKKVGGQASNPWQLPQGGIDDGEDPRVAVFRELAEETGTDKAEIIGEAPGWLSYDLPENIRDTVWKGRYRGQKQKWFALRFLGTDLDFNLNAHHKPEFSAWRWVRLGEISSLIVAFKRPMYDSLTETFAHLADQDN